jgi:heterodisulfide reductase subunit C
LYTSLTDLGYPLQVNRRRLPLLSVDDDMRLHTAREQECWQLCGVCPCTCPSQGASLCKYMRRFSLQMLLGAMPFPVSA